MTQGVGLSIGATNLAAVIPGFAAVTRRPVLTLYPHRPPEVGVPAENPRLDGRGLVVTDFVDRAADPVGIMATDGTFHRGEVLIAGALRALTDTATGGRARVTPPGVTYPAHWRPAAVAALRRELSALPEWSARPERLTLTTDAAAALTSLHAGPGLPTHGVVALCDFGGSGTSITLADAADGYRPIGLSVRHPDFSGELIDRALLTHVISDLRTAGTAEGTGTSAIGALNRLRAECRKAKERLSRSSVTSLPADVPGHRGEVRLTRAELDDEIHDPLASFLEVLREHLFRNRIHPADLAAVATIGGGANIPAVTTALSAQLRVPVITVARPELTAAAGAALLTVRRPEDDSQTAVARPVAQSTLLSTAQSTKMPAIAWSEVDDVPEIALLVAGSGTAAGLSAARPVVDFVPEEGSDPRRPKTDPWYRPILVTAGVFAAMVLVGTGAVMALRNDASAMAGTTTTTTVQPAPAAPAAAPPSELAVTPEQGQGAPSYIQAAPAPITRVVISTPPPVVMQAPAPAAPPPPVDNPPPPSAPPSTPTTTPPTSAPPPPSEPPSSPPSDPPSSPPSSEPPSSEPPSAEPPASQPPNSEPSEPPAQDAQPSRE